MATNAYETRSRGDPHRLEGTELEGKLTLKMRKNGSLEREREASLVRWFATPKQGPRRAAAARCSSVEFLVDDKREDVAGSEHDEEGTSDNGGC